MGQVESQWEAHPRSFTSTNSFVQNQVGVDPQVVVGLHESTVHAHGLAASAAVHAANVEASAAAAVTNIHSQATVAVVQAQVETEQARSQGLLAQSAAVHNEALLQEARRAAMESEQRRILQQQQDAAASQKLLEDERARFRQATAEQAHARDEAVGAERQSVLMAR